MMIDTFELLTGVSITIVTPALVEIAKSSGLPARYAGIAAVVFAINLVALGDLGSGAPVDAALVARWLIGGLVYGLAAAGLYSQTRPKRPAG